MVLKILKDPLECLENSGVPTTLIYMFKVWYFSGHYFRAKHYFFYSTKIIYIWNPKNLTWRSCCC